MNFLGFHGRLQSGSDQIRLGEADIAVPKVREAVSERDLVLGVRPEQVQFADASAFRGVVFGAEYLGTTQIVTFTTPHGTLRARVPADVDVRIGERIGLAFRPEKLSLFDKASGRAIITSLREANLHGCWSPRRREQAFRREPGGGRAFT